MSEFEIEEDELSEFADTEIENESQSELDIKIKKKKYKRRKKELKLSSDEETLHLYYIYILILLFLFLYLYYNTRKKKRRKISAELEQKLAKAQQYYLNEEFADAIELLLEVIKKKPNFTIPYVTLSMIHEEMGDEERSLEYLLLAAQLSENDSDLWANVAYKSKEIGNVKQALYCYKKAIIFDPKIDFLYQKAELLQKIGNYRGAITDLKLILKQDPSNSQTIEDLANIYFHCLNEPENGEEILWNGVKYYIDNDDLVNIDLNITNLLIELRISQENYNGALEITDLIIDNIEEVPIEIHVNRGICFAKLGNIERACKLFESVLLFSIEEYGDLYQSIGEVFLDIKEYKYAKDYLILIINLQSDTQYEVLYLLSKCEEYLNNIDKSIEYCQKSFNINPGYYKTCYRLVNIKVNKKEYDIALDIIEIYTRHTQDIHDKIILLRAKIFRYKEDYMSYIKHIEFYFTNDFLCTFNQKRNYKIKDKTNKDINNNNNNTNTDNINILPISESDLVEISNKVIEEDGETLWRFAAEPKIPKPKSDLPEINQKKDKFLEQLYEDIILYIRVLFKYESYDEVHELTNMIHNIHSRPFIKLTNRQYQIQYIKGVIALLENDYHNSYSHYRTLLWKNSTEISNWKLFAYVISKVKFTHSRTCNFLKTILKRDGILLPAILIEGITFLAMGIYYKALCAFIYAAVHYPNNPFVHLYAGITCISLVIHRKIINRHHLVILAVSFLSKYLNLRSNKMEANYNMGKAYQQIGLDHNAIYYYENVLNETNITKGRNYKRLAAYNLSLIYKKSGANALACQIVRNYLTY